MARHYWEGTRDLCPHCHGTGLKLHLAPLTKRQGQLYRYLHKYIAEHGYAPSFEDIAEAFGYKSLATVHEHLTNLDRKGYITRQYNGARSILCNVAPGEVVGIGAAA